MVDTLQHRGGGHCGDVARRRLAVHAGAFPLGIPDRLLAVERPAPMAAAAAGPPLAGARVAELDDVFLDRTATAARFGGRERAGGVAGVLGDPEHCRPASHETSARRIPRLQKLR